MIASPNREAMTPGQMAGSARSFIRLSTKPITPREPFTNRHLPPSRHQATPVIPTAVGRLFPARSFPVDASARAVQGPWQNLNHLQIGPFRHPNHPLQEFSPTPF